MAQSQSKRTDALWEGMPSCPLIPGPLTQSVPHYSSIKVVPVGASRGMKKLLQEKFPNMSRLQDISELLAT